MKYSFNCILLILVSYAFCSCSKEKIVSNNQTPYINDFSKEIPKTINFTLNTNVDTSFRTELGTKITLTKGQFVKKNGEVEIGKVNFQFREYHNISEMIFGKLSTKCDEKIIATDGMFYINALTQTGDTLFLNHQKPILIEFHKNDIDTGYYVFYDEKNNVESFNWIKGGRVFVPEIWDTVSEKSYLSKIVNVLSVIELGFINCDKFINEFNGTDITVEIGTDINVPAYCCIVLKKYKSMVAGYFDDSKFNFKNIPLNEDAILVCVGKLDEKYYLAMKEFKATKNKILKEQLILRTKEEVVAELSKLNKLHSSGNL